VEVAHHEAVGGERDEALLHDVVREGLAQGLVLQETIDGRRVQPEAHAEGPRGTQAATQRPDHATEGISLTLHRTLVHVHAVGEPELAAVCGQQAHGRTVTPGG
jgi:hypothetical protein